MRIITLLLILLSFSASAQTTPPISARLISPYTSYNFTPAPTIVPMALEIKLPQGWHTYWRTPGIAGVPPALAWDVKQNVSNVEIQYPAPQRIVSQGFQSFGYHNAVTFPLLVTLASPANPYPKIKLVGRVDIIMCADICVPASAPITYDSMDNAGPVELVATKDFRLDASAPVQFIPTPDDMHESMTSKLYADYNIWQKAYEQVPHGNGAAINSITRNGNALDITVQHDVTYQFTDVLVENTDGIILQTATITPVDGGTRLTAAFDTPSEATMLDGKPVTLTLLGTPNAIELTGTVSSSSNPKQVSSNVSAGTDLPSPFGRGLGEGEQHNSLLIILLIALLGGLILNLMPCVLPVLSLKILTIISHAGHDSMAQVRRGFMASTLGILVSFWLLAAGTIALRETGMALGWGLQFQHPGFLIGIIIVLLLFTANMFGLFEFRLPAALQNKLGRPVNDNSVTKEFFTGMTAAVLATPCSAPFVGTAISFALAQSNGTIIAIFTALGLGLALPYLLVAAFPRIAQHLPRPGAWMRHIRTLMGLLLLGSAVWFGSVLYAQVKPTTASATTEWTAFAPENIPALVASGKTVFLDITAEWCLTCHANKALVLNREPTRSALQAENIVLMQGDWTRPSNTIQTYLKKYNRYGIPFNIVFGPSAAEGVLLPELLTHDAVTRALAKAR